MRYMENLKNQFEPRRVGLIKDRKKKIELEYRQDVVEAIEGLEEGEYLWIPANVRIIPHDYFDAKHFSKRGRHLNIPVPRTREENLKERKSLQTRICERFSRAKGDYRGYGWSGLNPVRHKVVPLTEVVEGLELYALHLKGLLDGIKIEDYGERCFATVPSRDVRRDPHRLEIMTLPDDNSKNPWADALDIEPGCDCEFSNYRGKLTYKYKRGEDRFCAHAVAAIFAIAHHKKAEERPELHQSPVPIPRKKLIEFNDKLRNDVVKRRGRGDRPLNETEIEVLDWEHLKKYNEAGKGPQELFWFDDSALYSKSAARYAVN